MDSVLITDMDRFVGAWKVQQRWKVSDDEFRGLLRQGDFVIFVPAEASRIAPNGVIVQRCNKFKEPEFGGQIKPGSLLYLEKYSVFEFELANPHLIWPIDDQNRPQSPLDDPQLRKCKRVVEPAQATQDIGQMEAEAETPTPRVASANEARAQRTAEKWALYLKQAVSLAVECRGENKARSGKEHASMWNVRFGEAPTREALRAMRRGLPDDMVKGER